MQTKTEWIVNEREIDDDVRVDFSLNGGRNQNWNSGVTNTAEDVNRVDLVRRAQDIMGKAWKKLLPPFFGGADYFFQPQAKL